MRYDVDDYYIGIVISDEASPIVSIFLKKKKLIDLNTRGHLSK